MTENSKTWPEFRGHWLKGSMSEIQKAPLELYQAIRKQCGHYAAVRLLPGIWIYFVMDPSGIEHILQKNQKNYRKSERLIAPMRLLLGNGIFNSRGDFWLRQKRLMQPIFHRQHIQSMSVRMSQIIGNLLASWDRGDAAQEHDLGAVFYHLTLRIAGSTLFSADIQGEVDAFGMALRDALEHVSGRLTSKILTPIWFPTEANRRFRQAKATLDKIVLGFIEAKRKQPAQSEDLLDLLLAAQDDETREQMTDEQVKDETLTLMVAGHETTAAALTWAWYLLAQNPKQQELLHEEAQGQLSGRVPTWDDLPKLPYTRAVFDEAVRLYPPAWGIPREALGPDEIEGRPLPKNAFVMLSPFITHRDADFWPQPEQFQPERFLADRESSRAKFAYFPFGGGPRICIGSNFAIAEATLVLAAIAQHYRVELKPGLSVVPDPTFSLKPRDGLAVTINKRHLAPG